MRKRDRLGCWQQLLTLVGPGSLSEKQWVDLYKNYLRSWNRIYYLKLDDEKDLPAADPLIERQNDKGRHRYPMAPPSTPSVNGIKRRNSLASPSATSFSPIKRRNSVAAPSSPSFSPIKRRNSVAAPLSPLFIPIKRRNSLAPPPTATPTKSLYIKGQDCDPLLPTVKRTNSVTADDFDPNNHGDMFLSPIKRSDSVLNEIEIDCDAFNSHDLMALNQWMKPIKIISPLAPSPRRPDTDLKPNPKYSVFPTTPNRIKRRDSSVAGPSGFKSKSKPKNVGKMPTVADEELEDEMPLAAWKKYSAQRKKLKEGSPKNGSLLLKLEKDIKVELPIKRKRGRPSREEKAKRLEEENALKMIYQTSEPIKKSTTDGAMQDLEQQVRAPQTHNARKKQQKQRKTISQTTIKLPHQLTQFHTYAKSPNQKPTAKPPKKKPTAKPRCQSSSSVTDQDGADIAILSNVVVQPAILDEDAVAPAHMPADAIDLKNPSTKPPEDKVGEKGYKKEEAEDEKDVVRIRKNERSMLKEISSDQDEDVQHLILQETGLFFNDLEAEEQLLDDCMTLTSPVGGEEGDRNALEIDFDIDLLVRDETVANQIALIDSQTEMSLDRCLEATDNKPPSETPPSPKTAVEDQLTHTSEFFEKLPSRPTVDVSADQSNLLWPFMDEGEVLDYEPDYDVLTLEVSSDELEDECPSKSKGETKPSENNSEPVNQTNLPKVQAEPPSNQPEIPITENLRNFRIPRLAPELLKSQPVVMQTLYLQQDEKQQREKIKSVPPPVPPVAEDISRRREEAKAARRPKETMPQFAPPYRPTREDPVAPDLSQPMFGPQDLATPPLFGPEDLAPVFVPPSNGEKSNYGHLGEARPCREMPPDVSVQQHPPGASQYVPQNLATAEMLPPRHQGLSAKHWMTEIFGVKCLNYLGNKCLVAYCDHATSPVGEVERRLLSMTEEALVSTYRQALRSLYIFERYFKCFADIFERRKLYKHLLQMLAKSRYYQNTTVPIVRHVFRALKVAGLEREATHCLMTDLWIPSKAHKFSELMVTILQILEAGNWQDYIDQLVELHETYKFLLSEELMIRIMTWADVTKNEALQKKSMMMLLADMTKYARSPALKTLVDKFSNLETNSNLQQTSAESIPALSRRSPAQQQQQQHQQSIWNLNANPNQIPDFIPQQDRLPGAASSLIRISSASGQPPQYPASFWNPNPQPNQNLPGAVPGPSLIRSNPALTPHWSHNPNPNPCRDLPGAGPGPSRVWNAQLPGNRQGQQQQHPTSIWRSQATDDNTFLNFPSGFQ
ncbi:protein deadlock isoform X1 [Drosophila kikkawai]|uniref:Protein deadlock isoform X1 n=1 Tax=Drosophila kikkawai TaxID=30033 RepID=A0A6P4JAT8_DROKI|nr:protein deadlock isoform X2 [Drosophila kikkawai]